MAVNHQQPAGDDHNYRWAHPLPHLATAVAGTARRQGVQRVQHEHARQHACGDRSDGNAVRDRQRRDHSTGRHHATTGAAHQASVACCKPPPRRSAALRAAKRSVPCDVSSAYRAGQYGHTRSTMSSIAVNAAHRRRLPNPSRLGCRCFARSAMASTLTASLRAGRDRITVPAQDACLFQRCLGLSGVDGDANEHRISRVLHSPISAFGNRAPLCPLPPGPSRYRT